jgi:hypothetical protein
LRIGQIIEDRPIINNAKAIASNGQLGQAINVAATIRPGRALYPEAQGLIGEWVYQIQLAEDRSIMAQAYGLASQGYLTRAIEVASSIAPGRPLYGESRGAIGQWAAERAEIWRQRDAAPQPAPSYDEAPAESAEPEYREPERSEPAASPEPTPP